MIHFLIYTIDNAPDGSKQALGGLEQAFGFLPNVAGAMGTNSACVANTIRGMSRQPGHSRPTSRRASARAGHHVLPPFEPESARDSPLVLRLAGKLNRRWGQ